MSTHLESASKITLADLIAQIGAQPGAKPPVHLWHPERCGDIGLEIRTDGTWYHEGRPIRREALVRLFASILRRDPDGFYLVTPAEKVTVRIEDAPFTVVRADRIHEGGRPVWAFTTNVGDVVVAGPANPLHLGIDREGANIPYVVVRAGLEARILRNPYYELVQAAEERDGVFGVESHGVFFPLHHAAEA